VVEPVTEDNSFGRLTIDSQVMYRRPMRVSVQHQSYIGVPKCRFDRILVDVCNVLVDVAALGNTGRPGLLAERLPLYERWADIRVDCGALAHDGAVDAIIEALAAR